MNEIVFFVPISAEYIREMIHYIKSMGRKSKWIVLYFFIIIRTFLFRYLIRISFLVIEHDLYIKIYFIYKIYSIICMSILMTEHK